MLFVVHMTRILLCVSAFLKFWMRNTDKAKRLFYLNGQNCLSRVFLCSFVYVFVCIKISNGKRTFYVRMHFNFIFWFGLNCVFWLFVWHICFVYFFFHLMENSSVFFFVFIWNKKRNNWMVNVLCGFMSKCTIKKNI